MAKIKIEYDPTTGKAVKDGELHEWANDIVERYKTDKSVTRKIATETCVDILRTKVNNGDIDHKDIVFIYKDDEIVVDKFACLSHYPKGFCETTTNLLEELIGWKIPVINLKS